MADFSTESVTGTRVQHNVQVQRSTVTSVKEPNSVKLEVVIMSTFNFNYYSKFNIGSGTGIYSGSFHITQVSQLVVNNGLWVL
jgi:hypothetical protein